MIGKNIVIFISGAAGVAGVAVAGGGAGRAVEETHQARSDSRRDRSLRRVLSQRTFPQPDMQDTGWWT